MKLRRSDPADPADMRLLWPHVRTHFATATQIVEAFYDAFPGEPDDHHLGDFVVHELACGGHALPRS